jgi:hypothetical protein
MSFKNKPSISEEILKEYKNHLLHIENEINKQLSDTGFDSICFHENYRGDIVINGLHKEVQGYYYSNSVEIKKDFSNYIECIDEFVTMWKEYDTPERVKAYKEFIRDGERWGWD